MCVGSLGECGGMLGSIEGVLNYLPPLPSSRIPESVGPMWPSSRIPHGGGV